MLEFKEFVIDDPQVGY